MKDLYRVWEVLLPGYVLYAVLDEACKEVLGCVRPAGDGYSGVGYEAARPVIEFAICYENGVYSVECISDASGNYLAGQRSGLSWNLY